MLRARMFERDAEPFAAAVSAVVRSWNAQDVTLASAADLSWLGFSYVAFRLIHMLRERQMGKLPALSLREHMTYVIFFPALTAGPIDRAERFVKDLRALPETPLFTAPRLVEGLTRIAVGLFKKFVIGDSLALFALNAGAMFSPPREERYLSFLEWMSDGEPTAGDWDLHMSTLFPEVRPKGFFEIRSPDMVDPSMLAAPIAFIAGLVYDDRNARTAGDMLSQHDESLLARAGARGLQDSEIASVSREIAALANDPAARERMGQAAAALARPHAAAQIAARILDLAGARA